MTVCVTTPPETVTTCVLVTGSGVIMLWLAVVVMSDVKIAGMNGVVVELDCVVDVVEMGVVRTVDVGNVDVGDVDVDVGLEDIVDV